MKILYDHQAFSLQKYGGVSRIFAELLKGINSFENEAYLAVLFSNNEHLREKGFGVAGFFPDQKIPLKQSSMYILNEVYSALKLRTTQYDIYHPTYYNTSLIPFDKKAPVVATFHDMIHEKYAQYYPELKKDNPIILQKRKIAERADHIIAVSENTKKDLIELYKVPEEKITVVHLGSSLSMPIQMSLPKSAHPYFLYVGNRGGYKNFIPFLRSIADLLIKHKMQLICAGGNVFSQDEINIIESLNVQSLVIQEKINDQKLAELYANAFAFVFPSLYEGFGIPVLEAFSCNCPCILSDSSSLPEVARDAAIYMNPTNSDSMRAAVETLIMNPGNRAELIKEGISRLNFFSWGKHVEKTMEVYKHLIN